MSSGSGLPQFGPVRTELMLESLLNGVLTDPRPDVTPITQPGVDPARLMDGLRDFRAHQLTESAAQAVHFLGGPQ